MLGDNDAYPTIAVSDVEAAKEFYEETLGFQKLDENEGGVTYKSGKGKIFVYPSQYAGTNQATYASWQIKDIEAVVDELKSKGVVFEHYENMPDTILEGDIHVSGELKIAWFKDPAGNILSIDNQAD